MTGKKLVMLIGGTRPEAIKLAPVIWGLDETGVEYIFVWSGQHYDYEMSRVFFEELKLPEPVLDLDVGSGTHAEQTAKAIIGIENAIKKLNPSVVVAQGDTNTVAAAALASAKTLTPFAHVEAGLRSWDRTMPEEINRVLADALAQHCFAPTELAAINLMHEGIPIRKIHVTGNTIVDAVHRYITESRERRKSLLTQLNLGEREYAIATIHRQENISNPEKLGNIAKALATIAEEVPVIFPLHPRTRKTLENLNLTSKLTEKGVLPLNPLGYFEFLGLLDASLLVLTDSGGVQEEAYILGIPTLTLRYNTERPETVLSGINKLVGTDTETIVKEAKATLENRGEIIERWRSMQGLLGKGDAGARIAKILAENLEEGVDSIDSREDPFITYAMVSPENVPWQDIVAIYDERGFATVTAEKARVAVVRASHTRLKALAGAD
jgi:UDP-N-acetylglucosamine 2-epimerase (non-hydrolysing)